MFRLCDPNNEITTYVKCGATFDYKYLPNINKYQKMFIAFFDGFYKNI